jgi:hypothetical protein
LAVDRDVEAARGMDADRAAIDLPRYSAELDGVRAERVLPYADRAAVALLLLAELAEHGEAARTTGQLRFPREPS